jgi:cellulose synthase (UDP-forming)
MRSFLLSALALAAFLGLFALALIPLGLSTATDMAYVVVAATVVLGIVPGRTARLFFVTLCAWVVVRYLGWRFDSLPLDNGVAAGVGAVCLLLAELYGTAMLLLGLFVNAYPLDRKPAPLPKDEADYPSVDVYIPTYSEPVSVVAPTLMAAMELDYPRHKFNVYILDDGFPRSQNPATKPEVAHELAQRAIELQALCARHGATWLTREKNEHAKSGNMNAAMQQTSGELILILDADHVPSKDFLRNTAGFFVKDEKLAFVQTPHFFLNADPVEKNLNLFNRIPAENDMFYRVVQKGLDLWNASFFCGSAALLRRTAVLDVGGFSIDSITEDASTSVKMHQKGWRSAYLAKPMVAGLQPETFSGFTVQRLRWAMGMAQIFVKQNPLVVRGLSAPQRLSYLSVVMFWLFPFARTMFFIAPFLSIFFNLTIYPLGTEFFWAYTVPYLVAVLMSFERTFGRVRSILMSELYETLQSFYALPALIATFLRPNAPTFKVTPKGERLDEQFISEFRWPFYCFYAMAAIGLAWGGVRMLLEPESRGPLTLSVFWLFFNFALLSGALGVLLEAPQRRNRPRVESGEAVELIGDFGNRAAIVVDVNETGAMLRSLDKQPLPKGFGLRVGELTLPCEELEARRPYLQPHETAVTFAFPTPQHERSAVTLAYGSSKRWEKMWDEREASRNFLWGATALVVRSVAYALRHLQFISRGSR